MNPHKHMHINVEKYRNVDTHTLTRARTHTISSSSSFIYTNTYCQPFGNPIKLNFIMLLSRAFERSLPYIQPQLCSLSRSCAHTHTAFAQLPLVDWLADSHRELYTGFWWSFTKHKLLTIRIQFMFHSNVMSFECVHNFGTRTAYHRHFTLGSLQMWHEHSHSLQCDALLIIRHSMFVFTILYFFFRNLFCLTITPFFHSVANCFHFSLRFSAFSCIEWKLRLKAKKADFCYVQKKRESRKKVNMRQHCYLYCMLNEWKTLSRIMLKIYMHIN